MSTHVPSPPKTVESAFSAAETGDTATRTATTSAKAKRA
jgi:hypothetical protein